MYFSAMTLVATIGYVRCSRISTCVALFHISYSSHYLKGDRVVILAETSDISIIVARVLNATVSACGRLCISPTKTDGQGIIAA